MRQEGVAGWSRWVGALAATLVLVAGCTEDSEPEVVVVPDASPDAGPDAGDAARLPQCANGVDDDGDGLIDLDDPGCSSAADDDESDEAPLPQCSNRVDDDGDGLVDLADPGCRSPLDDDESDDPPPPACSNGLDDDEDGYTDFPADPGCASPEDDDELDDFRPVPQCSDGIDNDRDGLVDLADPGCTSPADPNEADPQTPPACANGLDDDGDGIIDFPLDPGCSAAGDDDETTPERAPACADGVDNDGDGKIDYPDDPGCAGVGDRDETDPPVPPACADGIDNDRDGRIDYPEDPGCDSAGDTSESGSCGQAYDPIELRDGEAVRADTRQGRFQSEGTCGGRGAPERVFSYRVRRPLEALVVSTAHPETAIETAVYVRRTCLDARTEVACNREPLNDGVAANTFRVESPFPGDYYIFVDGLGGNGGVVAVSVTEVPLAECRNGLDDDGDGRIDFPNDPGCESLDDRSEANPAVLPQCANDEDDDGDGLVDYPLDVGCLSANDDDEVDQCGQGVRVLDYPMGAPFMLGDARGGTTAFSGSCIQGGNGEEVIVRYANPHNARLVISVDHPETAANTGLYIRRDCVAANTELPNGCSLGVEGRPRGSLRLDRVAPGDYFIFVDRAFGVGGPFKLSVQSQRLPPGCSDGIDNDGDGLIDGEDPGCESPDDEDERDPPAGTPRAACNNGLDDDGDGLVDFPFDPGCSALGDQDETDPPVPPECADGIDNDNDGRIDFPNDPGCESRGDDSERNRVPPPQCTDSQDNDGDGRIDYPDDPGCDGAGDSSEANPRTPHVCSNGLDDDRDGLVDYPFDPGCIAASGRTEEDPRVPAACSDGIDNDEDGRIDFPRDPGCRYAADPDETNPRIMPQCANGRDDDNDGRIDFPDDPGCRFAADNDEVNQGPLQPRCSDGIDNDDDGLIDLADPGCENARDNDEADPPVLPACADGVDNDGDGRIDWPDDDGCAARGDVCEQAGFGVCEGQCVDITTSRINCGVCGRTCDEGVECIDGFCGGLYVFEGIQQNVPEVNLGGWQMCHRDLYADNTPIDNFLNACNGEFVMYGCRRVGQANFQLLAMGERNRVFQDTGDGNNALNQHNGVGFYFSRNTSIGFVAAGSQVSRNSCDTQNERPELRMCWHTGGNRLNGGYRCGAQIGLNGDRNWERIIFTSR